MNLEQFSRKTSPIASILTKPDKRIPRPSNCFIAYRMAIREKVKTGNPKMNGKEISQLAGKMWKSEPEYVKDHFRAIAEKLKAEHTSKYPNYSYSPRKRRNSYLYDSCSSCEESYNNESFLDQKPLRVSHRHVTLDENRSSENEDVVCDEMVTPAPEPINADDHTLSYNVQDNQTEQYEVNNAVPFTLDAQEHNVKQEYNTDDLLANNLEYAKDSHLLSSLCDYGLSDEASSSYPSFQNAASSQDSDWLQDSLYAYTPGYDSLYSYYVFES